MNMITLNTPSWRGDRWTGYGMYYTGGVSVSNWEGLWQKGCACRCIDVLPITSAGSIIHTARAKKRQNVLFKKYVLYLQSYVFECKILCIFVLSIARRKSLLRTAETTLVQVIMFNLRRQGEVSRMTLDDYERKTTANLSDEWNWVWQNRLYEWKSLGKETGLYQLYWQQSIKHALTCSMNIVMHLEFVLTIDIFLHTVILTIICVAMLHWRQLHCHNSRLTAFYVRGLRWFCELIMCYSNIT